MNDNKLPCAVMVSKCPPRMALHAGSSKGTLLLAVFLIDAAPCFLDICLHHNEHFRALLSIFKWKIVDIWSNLTDARGDFLDLEDRFQFH